MIFLNTYSHIASPSIDGLQYASPIKKKDGQLRLTPQGGKIRCLAKGEWGFPHV